MPIVRRLADEPYTWDIDHVPLERVANVEREVPADYIRADGFGITPACRRYLSPLIQGEAPPPYEAGLPRYITLKNIAVEKRLPRFVL
jgi:ATP-dependent phosphofructokinase / diphosphate-dependent phosphofructokinase